MGRKRFGRWAGAVSKRLRRKSKNPNRLRLFLEVEVLEDRRLLASVWQNPLHALDVADDGIIAPIDVLLVINDLNTNGSRQLVESIGSDDPFLDTDGDGFVSPVDALLVINLLNSDQPVATITLALENDSGLSPDDHVSNDARIRGNVSLDSIPGSVVGRIDRGPIFPIDVDVQGNIQFDPTASGSLSDGLLHINVAYRHGDGRQEVKQISFELDRAPPLVNGLPRLAPESDSGSSNSDGNTNVASPTLEVATVDAYLAEFSVDDLSLGQANAMDGVAKLRLNSTLAEGVHRLRVQLSDVAGNMAVSSPTTLEIDTTTPATPTLDLAIASDSGNVGDHSTHFERVTLTGETEALSFVHVVEQGVVAQSNGAGEFQLTGVTLIPGTNQLKLRVTDLAGNTSEGGGSIELVSEESVADPILRWNQAALEAIRLDATAPPIATRALAMMSVAMLDVVNAIQGAPGVLVSLPVTAQVSLEAAISAAAFRVIEYLFPAQSTANQAVLTEVLNHIPEGAEKSDGVAFGTQIGAMVVAIREQDGWDSYKEFFGGTAPGEWRTTGPAYESALLPHWGAVSPFAISDVNAFMPAPPPLSSSQTYADSVTEVAALGRVTSSTRTADQTQIARFWADGGGTYSPPGHWNQIASEVAAAQKLSVGENARLFALLNTALADTAIVTWKAKYAYELWRPVTAIQHAGEDDNPLTVPDSTWSSFLITPPFPEYTSGHSSFSAAAAEVLTDYFGEDHAFQSTSIGLPNVIRSFTSFQAAAQEAGRSRVYGGIHFEFTNQASLEAGRRIGREVVERFALSNDSRPPQVVLFSPLQGQAFNSNPIITGSAIDNLAGIANVTAQLDNGPTSPVYLDSVGRFTFTPSLAIDGTSDGTHVVHFRATDHAGLESANFDLAFNLDTSAPELQIVSPLNPSSLNVVDPRLTGVVHDMGTPIVRLTYRWDSASEMPIPFAADGSFDTALDVSHLSIGNHSLYITARDAAGNFRTTTLSVDLQQLPTLGVRSFTPIDGALDVGAMFRPKIVFTRAIEPSTLNDVAIYFTDPSGEKIPATLVPADDATAAWVFFEQPLPSGANITMHIDGAQIHGRADGALLDADGDAAPGGSLQSQFRTVSLLPLTGTSLSGRIFGPGADLKPMTFDDMRAGPDGTLFTSDDVFLTPLEHVKVYVVGREQEAVFTNADGYFNFATIPAGNVKLAIDGRTASNGPLDVFFPEMVMDLNLEAGKANTVMGSMGSRDVQAAHQDRQEVYLPALPQSILTTVDDSQPTLIGVDGLAAPNLSPEQRTHLKLVATPGSLLDENGQPLADPKLGISTVPLSMVRDMLPESLQQGHSTQITIQAPGATVFSTPLEISFPNTTNAAPGTKLVIYSFDHTTGLAEPSGTATVSADGAAVVSDPGSGVVAPGWHFVNPAVRVTGAIRIPEMGVRSGAIFGGSSLPISLDAVATSVVPNQRPYVAFENLDAKFVVRIRGNDKGVFEQLLGFETNYRVYIYDAASDLATSFTFRTGEPASTMSISNVEGVVMLGDGPLTDADGDGLTDVAEMAVGTFDTAVDTDADLLNDFAELQAGFDPLGGEGPLTGEVARVNLDGDGATLYQTVISSLSTRPGRSYAFFAGEGLDFETFTPDFRMAIADVTDALHPVTIWSRAYSEQFAGQFQSLAIDELNNVLAVQVYDSNGLPKVQFYDVSTPERPVLIQTVSTETRRIELHNGLAYLLQPDPFDTYSSPTGYCILCSPRDRFLVYDYRQGEMVQNFPTFDRLVHDFAYTDDALYVVANYVTWIRTGNTTVSPKPIMVLDKYALSSTGQIIGLQFSHRLFDSMVSNSYYHIDVQGDVLTLTNVNDRNATFPGLLTFRILDDGFEALGPFGDISSIYLGRDGSGLAVYTAPTFVSVLDLRDPTKTDRILASFDPTYTSSNSKPAVADGKIFVAEFNVLRVINYQPLDDSDLPFTSILRPTAYDVAPEVDGLQIQGGTTLVMSAAVTQGKRLSRVDLFEDDRLIQSDIRSPYQFKIDIPLVAAPQTRRYHLRITDPSGRIAESNRIVVDVLPDTFAPQIIDVSVDEGIAIGREIESLSVTFSEVVDVTKFTADTFQLVNVATQQAVPLTILPSSQTVTMRFSPLIAGNYSLRVAQGELVDRLGNRPLAEAFIRNFEVLGSVNQWTGLASANWHDAANWSLGRVPLEGDEVVISAGAPEVTIDADNVQVLRLEIHRPLRVAGVQLSVRESIRIGADLILDNGTLRDTTVESIVSTASVRVADNSTSTLRNVRLRSDMFVSEASSQLVLQESLDLNGQLAISNGQGIRFSGDEHGKFVLRGSGEIRVDSRNSVSFQGDQGVVEAEIAEDIHLEIASNFVFAFAGNNGQLVMNGSLRVLNSASASVFSSQLSGNGKLVTSSGTLSIYSPISTQTLPMLQNEGGTIALSGTVDNRGNTFTPTLDNGVLTLASNSRILGGVIAIDPLAGGLAFASASAAVSDTPTLEDVTIVGRVNLGLGSMRLAGDWHNNGTIETPTKSRLILDGNFDADRLGQLVRSGGSVIVAGVYDNCERTIDLTASPGPWQLFNGRILGGTVVTGNGSVLSPSDGTLDGVTVVGDLNVTNLRVENGLTVAGRINLPQSANLRFLGPGRSQTLRVSEPIASNGNVVIGQDHTLEFASEMNVVARGYLGRDGTATGTRFINRGVIETTVASFTLASGVLENFGTLRVSGTGEMTIRGDWTNAGVLELQNGKLNLGGEFQIGDLGTFNRTGGTLTLTGTLDNRGQSFATSAAIGSMDANGGRILGGTLLPAQDGTSLTGFGPSGLKLEDVEIDSTVDFTVAGRLDLIGNFINRGTLQLNAGDIRFAGTSRYSQLGNFVRTGGHIFVDGTLDFEGLALDTQALFQGEIWVFGTLKDTVLSAASAIRYLAPMPRFQDVTLNAGAPLPTTLGLDGNLTLHSDVVINNIELGPGNHQIQGNGRLLFTTPSSSSNTIGIDAVVAGTRLTIASGIELAGQNAPFRIGPRIGSNLDQLTNYGTIRQTTAGKDLHIHAVIFENFGFVATSASNISTILGFSLNEGTVLAGVGTKLQVTQKPRSFAPAGSGTYVAQIAGPDDSQRGRYLLGFFQDTGTVDPNGILKIEFVEGYDPALGTSLLVADQLTAEFDEIEIVGLAMGKVARARYQGKQFFIDIMPVS